MKNSQKFKIKLIVCKISCLLLTALIIYFIIKYGILELLPFFDKVVVILIGGIINICILIISLYYIVNLGRFTKEEKEKIYYDLDNNTEKVFKYFGLYITKNYIVFLGNKLNLFRLFVIPIKDIDAIDTQSDNRYYYRNRKNKSKNSFFHFVKASIKTDIMYGDNSLYVFNIICGKKVYCIATASTLNERKIKKIDEVADYICDRYENIDYI